MRAPNREHDVGHDQTKTGDEQACAERKQPEPGRQLAAEREKAGQQCNEAGREQNEGRQRPAFGEQWSGGQHRNELQQSPAHGGAEPTDCDHMHQDQRIG